MDRVAVKPELLRWARERAGLTVSALEKQFPRVGAWEQGESSPTLKQLEKFASKVFVPVGFLLLPEPPVERMPIPDFRTFDNVHVDKPSPNLLDTLYLCQQRQDWYRGFMLSTGTPALDYVGSAQGGDDVVQVAARIRTALAFDVDERGRLASWTEGLRQFIHQADAAGVLVMVSSVVGQNTHRHLSPEEFRGFALADHLAPLVFVNGADTKAAQMFTLAHELAHIWLGQSAVSDAQASSVPNHGTERWCNQVAAEMLVPIALLEEEFDPNADLRKELDRLARRYKVSTLVILRRIRDAGGLTAAGLRSAYARELERLRRFQVGGGGDFYRSLPARVGKRFARALVVSTLEGHTTFSESFRLLGIKKLATFNNLGRSLGVGA